MDRHQRYIHLIAAVLFSLLSFFASVARPGGGFQWPVFRILTLVGAGIAWMLYFRSRSLGKKSETDACSPENLPFFPEGQARLIDSGRLPNRYNPRVELHDFEICHFYVPARRLFFAPLPDKLQLDPSRLTVRFSGGIYYFILRPQEILLPADIKDTTEGELVITSQRIIFLAGENAFEVPLQRLKLLDCSAHLVDFQVRDRRYTLQTEAACYAEKVLMLLLQRPQD